VTTNTGQTIKVELDLANLPTADLLALAKMNVVSYPAAARSILMAKGWDTPSIILALGDHYDLPVNVTKAKTNGVKNVHKPMRTVGATVATPELLEEFTVLWNDHSLKLDDISTKLGVPIATMRRWANVNNLPARPRGRKPAPPVPVPVASVPVVPVPEVLAV